MLDIFSVLLQYAQKSCNSFQNKNVQYPFTIILLLQFYYCYLYLFSTHGNYCISVCSGRWCPSLKDRGSHMCADCKALQPWFNLLREKPFVKEAVESLV